MRNNYLNKIENQPVSVLLNSKRSAGLIGLMLGFFTCQNTQAQLVNQSDLKVDNGVVMAIYMDYINEASGIFSNDGNVYVFQNWHNDGKVTYSGDLIDKDDASKYSKFKDLSGSLISSGFTFFNGGDEQFIDGRNVSNFRNVVFNNSYSSKVPFHLRGSIAVGENLDFKLGIINAGDYDGKVVFKGNSKYSNVGDLSFVDGMVEKKGETAFRFPVGDEFYFRPAYRQESKIENGDYTTQYFKENSEDLHSHSKKDESVKIINNTEYWTVNKEKGDENIVLSLTLDNRTTPSEFFDTGVKIAIVRWDETAGKWVNEGGEVNDPTMMLNGDGLMYVTAQVNGYGMFTLAIVQKTPPPIEDLIVYNAVSPNGDGINDTFHIKGIDKYPDNTVEIFNRWGVKVYDAKSYNESDNMFGGYSDGRTTVNRGDKLPTGTYFYILKYNNGVASKQKTGYLYINNQ